MEYLHLTYDEVLNRVPYRDLLVMQKDKQHVLFDSDNRKEVSDEEYFQEKGGLSKKFK